MILSAVESPDLLRITNGDQRHGEFQGLNSGSEAIWKPEDILVKMAEPRASPWVEKSQGVQALKGRNLIRHLLKSSALSGLNHFVHPFPGRCPGLSHVAPLEQSSPTFSTRYEARQYRMNLESTVMLDFKLSNLIIDDWDAGL